MMEEKYKKLQRPLSIDEIDFRVQSTSSSGYVTIVPYKDARTDMRILTESGCKWQRKHEIIDNQLFCSIGIYDEDIKEWVWRQDVGTESNTEKEKGRSSDSFKRAGTNWGIGTELYTMPRLGCMAKSGEDNGRKIYPNSWMWSIERDENNSIKRVVGKDSSGTIRVDARVGGNNQSASSLAKSLPELTPTHKNWKASVEYLAKGNSMDNLKKHYRISTANVAKLKEAVNKAS